MSLQVLEAGRLAAAAAAAETAARQQAFYSRLLDLSGTRTSDERFSPQSAARHSRHPGAFRLGELGERFHPYDHRV